MSKLTLILGLSLFWLNSVSAQFGKNFKYADISLAATLNYNPSIEPYTFSTDFETDDEVLILDFITKNSGVFVIEEQEPVYVQQHYIYEFPAQSFNFGVSLQIKSDVGYFQELSISQMASSRTQSTTVYDIQDTLGQFTPILARGAEQKAAAFGFRYEFGKYFGYHKSALRFALSVGVEPSFYRFTSIPNIGTAPLKARITKIQMAVIPMLSARIAKRLFLDFKLIPNFQVVEFSNVYFDNPQLPSNAQQQFSRETDPIELDLAATLAMRCVFKDKKKRKKRR